MFRRLNELERRWRAHYNVAPVDAETWRRARIYNAWFDHAILRTFWTNQSEIAPGVWRSNHPGRARLARMKAKGLRTVISLRGGGDEAHNATERIWCDELGLTLRFVAMTDKALPLRETLLTLIETFREAEGPILIHCKAGADRAGLASAVWLLTMTDTPLSEARKMLSWRHLHMRSSRAGVLGEVLDAYAKHRDMPFADWVAEVYDPEAVAAGRGARR
jgi:protein tyrosine/serine phosphatase